MTWPSCILRTWRNSAVVAAEAFHWLDWHAVLPRIAESVVPGGHLILIERTLGEPLPWEPDLRGLIREYSTNQDYVPYDTVTELEARGLITVGGRAARTIPPGWGAGPHRLVSPGRHVTSWSMTASARQRL
jgi:hypothetical protein